MNAIHARVLFELPRSILTGLKAGDFVRRGGVIQWATGPQKGQVVAWLREAGTITDPAKVLQPAPASQLGLTANALMGAQLLTLGVTVAGFALVNYRLSVMDRKLDGLLQYVKSLTHEVVWLDRRNDVAIRAKLGAALEGAGWAERTARFEQLPQIRQTLVEGEIHYLCLTRAMLETRRAHRQPIAYGGYLGMAALAGIARVRIEAILDGPDAGREAIGGLSRRLIEAKENFTEPMKTLDLRFGSLPLLTPELEGQMSAAIPQMTETVNRVDGYHTEYAYCAAESITLKDWQDLSLGETTAELVVIEPVDDNPDTKST